MADEGRLPHITATQALRALRRAGWFIARWSGSHAILHHPTKSGRVTIPMHRARTLRPATLS
ncbi:MAG TPA: type II toxin-antitoxin system HicA family toxin [Chloroflexota bacterium]